MSQDKYYDHDHIWQKRRDAKNPIWGRYSNKCYSDLSQHIGRLALPPARILDVGCGAGAFGKWLAELGYDYTGVDDSSEGISLGIRSFPDLKLYVSDFVKPLETQDWLSEGFDIVTSVNVLHCLTDPGHRLSFLKNLYSCLRPGGHMFLTGMTLPKVEGFRQADSPRCYKSKEDIIDEMKQASFSKIECLDFQLPNGRALIGNATIYGQRD